MKVSGSFEFPPQQERVYRKARRAEWLTLAYLTTSAAALLATMGSSQAMRTSFFEDLLSFIPPLAFLVGTGVARRKPTKEYPYGFHRATSIAFLVASIALLGMGGFLFFEAAHKFITQERTTIGATSIAGKTIWAGWPMLLAVVYSAIPSVLIGRWKSRLAPQIHNKVLHAQADMMKADWMAETATAIGVLGVGFGHWWLDPLAAALVSLDICKDGIVNLSVAIGDLIDRRPMRTDRSGPEELPALLEARLRELPWVKDARVRLREEGHVFFGEAQVIPVEGSTDLPLRAREAAQDLESFNWRVHDLVVGVVDRFV